VIDVGCDVLEIENVIAVLTPGLFGLKENLNELPPLAATARPCALVVAPACVAARAVINAAATIAAAPRTARDDIVRLLGSGRERPPATRLNQSPIVMEPGATFAAPKGTTVSSRWFESTMAL
jgi:hypothetical protein